MKCPVCLIPAAPAGRGCWVCQVCGRKLEGTNWLGLTIGLGLAVVFGGMFIYGMIADDLSKDKVEATVKRSVEGTTNKTVGGVQLEETARHSLNERDYAGTVTFQDGSAMEITVERRGSGVHWREIVDRRK